MNKHTPGPWSSGHHASETTLKSHERIAMPSWCAAGVWSMGCGEDEVKANARLIATAPELLDIAIEIKCWLEHGDHESEMHTKLCDAISKATGESK